MKFDFKQKEWSSIYMQFFKVTTAVLFIVSSNAVFQVVSSIFAFIFGLCLLIKRPNQVPWFDLIKGSAYLIYGSLCFVLFVCEIVVQDSDFITRLAISNSLPWIIVGFSGALIILAIWVYTAHLPDLGSQEVRKKQRKEFEVIFSYLRSAQQNKNLEFDAGEDNNEIISSGLKLGLLTPLQAKYIAKTIDNNQRTVLEVFRSSNKNYQTFMKLMEKPVWKILQKDFNYQKSNGPRFTRIGEKMNEVNNDSDQTEDDNEDYDY